MRAPGENSDPQKRVTRQAATFGAVSVVTTVLDFGLFNALVLPDVLSPIAANTISYGLGVLASYELNRRFTFVGGGRDKRSHELAIFVAINILGLVLNNAAVGLATATVGQHALLLNLAKLVAGGVTWGLKFVTFRRWVYPSRGEAATTES
ncbi:MAG: GtrA family protein [Actinomycetota bacterium]|nr:GtrA family protein [Actinomycetota bacterium]